MDSLTTYTEQGYSLPDGWTPEKVAAERERYGIRDIFVPVVSVAGVATGWGVPCIAGVPLRHLARE